jgi:hypothetical protein
MNILRNYSTIVEKSWSLRVWQEEGRSFVSLLCVTNAIWITEGNLQYNSGKRIL